MGLDENQRGPPEISHVLYCIPEKGGRKLRVKGTVVCDKRYFSVSLFICVREVCVSAWITERGGGLTSGGQAVCWATVKGPICAKGTGQM